MCFKKRGLVSIEDSVDASIQLEDYTQHDGGLITAIRNDTDNRMDNNDNNQERKMGRKVTLWAV